MKTMAPPRRFKLIRSHQRLNSVRFPRIALVIPAYNEKESLEKLLQEIQDLQISRPRWEILPVVVNDGSTDGTEVLLRNLQSKYRMQIVTLPFNLGIGCAVQTGFRFAVFWGADVALQIDGDGQHPPAEIPKLVGPILAEKADVMVGSRYLPGAVQNVSSVPRQMGTYLFSRLLRLTSRIKIQDVTSGFRAFGKEVTEFLASHYPDDYPEVEAYVVLAKKKFRIREVSVEMRVRARGSSSIHFLRSIYYMVKVTFAVMMSALRPLPLTPVKPHLNRSEIPAPHPESGPVPSGPEQGPQQRGGGAR